jgi:hypothetical protein
MASRLSTATRKVTIINEYSTTQLQIHKLIDNREFDFYQLSWIFIKNLCNNDTYKDIRWIQSTIETIENWLRAGRLGFRNSKGAKFWLFSNMSIQSLGPSQLHVKWVFTWAKAAKTWCWPLTNYFEVKNEWSNTSRPSLWLQGVEWDEFRFCVSNTFPHTRCLLGGPYWYWTTQLTDTRQHNLLILDNTTYLASRHAALYTVPRTSAVLLQNTVSHATAGLQTQTR